MPTPSKTNRLRAELRADLQALGKETGHPYESLLLLAATLGIPLIRAALTRRAALNAPSLEAPDRPVETSAAPPPPTMPCPPPDASRSEADDLADLFMESGLPIEVLKPLRAPQPPPVEERLPTLFGRG